MNITERKNFYYSFDIKKDLPSYVDHLPDGMLATIESQIVNVIYESFVITGDQDYLTARLLAQKGLPRAYYWAAAQALEKYLKAFLLLNGRSVLKYNGHPIKKLFNDAKKINETLNDINLSPSKDINIDNENRNLIKGYILDEFINSIEEHGCPDNRYNTSGIVFDTGHLFALDNFVYSLRKLIGVPSINNSFKNVEDDLISIFEDNNPLFCNDKKIYHSKIPSKKFQIKYTGSATELDYLIKHKDSPNHIFVLNWLNKKMKLSKNIKVIEI